MNMEQVINQLSPDSRKLLEQLITALAKQDGLVIRQTELPKPIDAVPLWRAYLIGEGKSPRTIELYEKDARAYLAKDPEPTTLSIQGYIAQRLGRVSAARVASEQKALKSLFGYLHKYKLCNENPCADMKLLKGVEKETDCPSDEEIVKLINHRLFRRADDARFKLMLMLLINTGLRLGEACAIEKQHINITRQEVKVVGKGSKERIVPISQFVAELLTLYLNQYANKKSPYLFPSNGKTGYWWKSGFEKALTLACKRVSNRPLHPHQFRHYFATRTLENGAKLEVISKLLGHASVGITAKIYRHISLAEYHKEHKQHEPLQRLLKGGGANEK